MACYKVIHRLLLPAIKAFLVHDPIEEANAELCATAAIPAGIIGSSHRPAGIIGSIPAGGQDVASNAKASLESETGMWGLMASNTTMAAHYRFEPIEVFEFILVFVSGRNVGIRNSLRLCIGRAKDTLRSGHKPDSKNALRNQANARDV